VERSLREMLRNEIKAMIGQEKRRRGFQQARVWSILQELTHNAATAGAHGKAYGEFAVRTVPRANRRIETLAQPITSKS